MRHKWLRIHTYLTVGILVLIAGIGYLLYLLWLHPLHEQMETLESKRMTEQKIVEILKEEQNNYEDIPPLRVLLQQLPSKKNVDQLLLQIEAASITSDAVIEEIKVSPIESEEENEGTEQDLPSVSMTLTVAAPDYFHMIEFIDAIQKSERFISVQSLQFNDDEVTIDSNEYYYFFLGIQAYYDPTLDLLEGESGGYHYGEQKGKRSPFYNTLRSLTLVKE